MSLDIFMSTLARAFSYVLPIVGVLALIYIILFLRQLIQTLKEVSKTLDTANDQLKKLDAPLKTAEDLSHTVDEVHESAKTALISAAGTITDNLQNAKDWFSKRKSSKKIEDTKEDE